MINKYRFKIQKYDSQPNIWTIQYFGDMLDLHKAHHYRISLEEDYPHAKIGIGSRWVPTAGDYTYFIYIQFKDDADEAEFILKESL